MKNLLFIFCIFTTTAINAQFRYNRDSVTKSIIGTQYPEYSFTTVSGETISSSDTKGKVVLINLWFKDCAPCRAEMEWFNELYDSLRTNTNFRFISIARETMEVLPGYIDFFHLSYPIVSLVDCDKYNLIGGFPTNIIIDKTGKVAYYKGGGPSDRAKARTEVLENLLPKIKALL